VARGPRAGGEIYWLVGAPAGAAMAAAAEASPPDPAAPVPDLVGARQGRAAVWRSAVGSPAAAAGVGRRWRRRLGLRGRLW
jgi:hypothetical protein